MAAEKTNFVVDPDEPTVVMTRTFDAPRRLVFEAMTKPDLIKLWYGPKGVTVSHCESDLRVGGAYRIVQRMTNGMEFGFRGVYREYDPPARRVYTWIFEPMPDKEAIVTETFLERAGKTTFTATLVFQTIADRDGYLATGAAKGGAEALDRIEATIKAMA